jgi:hypothetical protein
LKTLTLKQLRQFCDKAYSRFPDPITIGEYTYATNGAIAVRVPAKRRGCQVIVEPLRFDRILVDLFDIDFDAHLYAPVSCPPLGEVPEINGYRSVPWFKSKIDWQYLALMDRLPNVELALPWTELGKNPLPFRFDGGVGLVMEIVSTGVVFDL